MHTPMFNFEFSSPHRPAVSSPLSSSPIRPSPSPPAAAAAAALSPRDPNTTLIPPRRRRQQQQEQKQQQQLRDVQSSPTRPPGSEEPGSFSFSSPPSAAAAPKFKYAARGGARPNNPLRLSGENARESRRKLFLKNVRQRTDDRQWLRRGGDQEALKLEWAVLSRQWRRQKEADIDGIVFEYEIEDAPVAAAAGETTREPADDDVMADAMAQEEEAEMDAMLSMLEVRSPPLREAPAARPDSPSWSDDDDYDSLFRDMICQQEADSSQEFASSGQMDLS
ncbi:hypothetical protein GGR56DRAFT_677266 [Xylariaceae sp. FL0804]|nr:hypothetical protein GGR56DRAFT_677266 [Xylariaceae sp. FL0804]